MFSSALQNTGRFTVVERNKLNAVLQEKEFQAAQNGEDAVNAGKILAVKKMFSGSIGMLGKRYIDKFKNDRCVNFSRRICPDVDL